MKTRDFLVIGSGIAGLMFALDAAEHGSVTVLCKEEPTEGNTRYAQGGIASVIDPLDSFDSHIADTLDAGAGLCNEAVVRLCVTEGPSAINRLVQYGTQFDQDEDHFALAREGGHSARRILHSRDATGAEIQRALFERAKHHPSIEFLPHHLAIDLITDGSTPPNVLGVYAQHRITSHIVAFAARVTMIATGGAGRVYLYTSNPDVATGDGIAMALRAGAELANMEFIQFHPTCLFHPTLKSYLITEAMRGEGARLIDARGNSFMERYDARKELAPRDIVARAIDDHMKKTGDKCVFLDISHREPEFLRSRFPNIYGNLMEVGIDLTKEPIPVVPAAHYLCGGIRCDSEGRTNLGNLYVAGEAACTGLHGANRLASNSLLEAVVFAVRASKHVVARLAEFPPPAQVPEWDDLSAPRSSEIVLISQMWEEIRRLMWNLVGIVRSDRRLQSARKRIGILKKEVNDYYWRYTITPDLIELRNILALADAITYSALKRRESRGLHFNENCPNRDDKHWRVDSIVTEKILESS